MTNSSFQIKAVKLSKIKQDGGTQARERMNPETIREYMEAMEAGATFPPVVLFQDGSDLWLGDGFHRVAAAREAGMLAINAEMRQGGYRDAVLFAVGANATHGLRRTNADKRRAVSRLLDDQEWAEWSDNEISKKCGVSQPFVSKMRAERVITVISSSNHEVSKPAPVEEDPEPQKGPVQNAAEKIEPVAVAPEPEPEQQTTEDHQVQPERAPAKIEPLVTVDQAAELLNLRNENESLKGQISELVELLTSAQEELEAARRILDAEDLMTQFRKEVVRAQELARVTQSRNNGLMNENADLIKRLKSALRKIDRLEKEAKKGVAV